MPKDNEESPLPIFTTDGPSEPALEPFAPDQMVRCDDCLRANPPTRVSCLYCAAALPLSESTVNLQKPALRPLEKWEQGYNNILLPQSANATEDPPATNLREAADLLRLRPADLTLIMASQLPLPLARAATLDEASLVQRRLNNLGIETCIVPDVEPGADSTGTVRVRSFDIDDAGVYAFQTPDAPAIRILWSDIVLLVVGRLTVKRVELKEQKGVRAEHRIVDSSEFFTDEAVVDIYIREQPVAYRIAANSFDFSCLGENKSLLARENIATLIQLIRHYAPDAEYDDSFQSARKALEAVWPQEQQNDSSGWRRDRPGKYSLGSITELSNEMQFLRYSRLRHQLKLEKLTKANDDA